MSSSKQDSLFKQSSDRTKEKTSEPEDLHSAKSEMFEDITDGKRNETLLRDFVETASIGLHCVGPDGTILWANQAELDLLGYTRTEYFGHHISEFHADAAVIEDILTRLSAREKLHDYEARLRASDGSIRYVLINSSVLFENGQFLHTRCFTRDITERKLTEEALRKSEAQLLRANTQLAQRMAELKKRNVEIRESRRAALNMMKDAQRSGRAIEKLNAELRKSGVLLELQRHALQLLAERAPLDEVLGFLLGVVEHHSAAGMRAAITPINEAGTHFQRAIGPSLPDAFNAAMEGIAVNSPAGVCAVAQTRHEAVAVSDFHADPEWRSFGDFVAPYGLRSGWFVPIISSKGHLLGTFVNYYLNTGDPTPESRELIDVVVSTAAIAIERTRAEEALQESHERVSNIVESITDAFVTLDKDWRFVYLNERAVEVVRPLNHSQATLLGKNIWEEFPEVIGTVLEENYRRAITEQVTAEFEYFHPLLRAWFEIRAYPAKDGLSIYFQDITARKRVETALAAEKKVLELIATGTPMPEVLDTLMRETEAQSTDEMLSSILLLDDTGQKLHHGAAPSLPATYNQAIHGVTIGTNVGSCGKAVFDGQQVNVFDISTDPLWQNFKELAISHGLYACCSTPIFSSHGEVLGAVAMYYRQPHEPSMEDRDVIAGAARLAAIVIERTRAREALRKSEARLRFMAESMPQKIFTAQPNGDIDYFNQQWMNFTGLSFEQIRDWGWTQFIHPDDLEENLRVWQKSIDTGEDFQLEHRCRRADGAYRWHLSRARAMQEESGNVLMWIGSSTDIDDVKQTEAELQSLVAREQAAHTEAQAANRVKDEFLATVSHELRTPLNAIVGWARLLRSGSLLQRDIDRAIEIIDRNADAQATIIDELLDISRIISGKLQIEQQPVNLVDVINAAREVTRPAAEAKAIEINLLLDGTAGPVIGDAVRLQQVIWNLLSNAIKFTPREGRVDVNLSRQGTDVVIVVSDTGQGIEPAFLPHVFERFNQADPSEKRLHGGLGLGLAIARHLVEMHGGAIRAESDGPHRGAVFTINLPIVSIKPLKTTLGSAIDVPATASQAISETGPAPEIPSDILSGVRVLVIDDQADARDLFTFALEQYKADVRVCCSAGEAFSEFLSWKPDVIVSDIGLPGEDGYELMERIRALDEEHGGRTPALALTGYASAVDQAKAFAAGYQSHLAKPVGIKELAGVVAKLSGKESRILS